MVLVEAGIVAVLGVLVTGLAAVGAVLGARTRSSR